MKLITMAFQGTEIYDDNGTVLIVLNNNPFGLGRIECKPDEFRDLTMRSDTIGGQHTNDVEKYYGIEY